MVFKADSLGKAISADRLSTASDLMASFQRKKNTMQQRCRESSNDTPLYFSRVRTRIHSNRKLGLFNAYNKAYDLP